MLENIVRHMEKGKPAMQAALDGAREIGFTIVSMTLSLTAVFIPVLLMGGIIGRLFHEFAVTIVSRFWSRVRVPDADADALQPFPPAAERRAARALVRGHRTRLSARPRVYEGSLGWVMDRRGLALVVSGLILVGTAVLFMLVPKGFIPTEDTGQIQGTTETLEGSSYENMRDHQLAVAAILSHDPNVVHFMSSIGGGTMNQGRVSIRLKPRGQRPPPMR